MPTEIEKIDEQKKVGCWVWPVLVIGSLLLLWGFCIGSMVIYGQLSGTNKMGQTVGSFLTGLSCLSILPFIIGSGMLGISIFNLLKKRQQPSPSQGAVRTVDSSGSTSVREPTPPAMPTNADPTPTANDQGLLSSKVIVNFQDPGSMPGMKGIEFLVDGNSKGVLQFEDVKEFEIPAGEHVAKMILHGVFKRSSNELKFSLRQGQIVCLEGEYSAAWGNVSVGFARDQTIGGRLIELQKKVSESVCTLCGKKSFDGETIIAVTGKIGDKYSRGNAIVQEYNDLHRIRVSICSDCQKDKEALEKAVVKKDTEFGRVGDFGYWRDKDFRYSSLRLGDAGYLFIKDRMKDELDDPAERKNVTLRIHSPSMSRVDKYEQQGIRIDGVAIALVSYAKGFDVSIHVGAGKHTIIVGADTSQNTRLTIFAEENKTYEFDCTLDKIKGGIKLVPRSSVD